MSADSFLWGTGPEQPAPKPATCRHPKSALRDPDDGEPCSLGGWCSKCGSLGFIEYDDGGVAKVTWRRPGVK